jgi:hypothetical protein
MIGCKDVATLLSTDQLGAQPFWHRIEARFHLTMCPPCRRFRRQLALLRRTAATIHAQYDEEVGADFVDRVHEKLTG